MKFIPDDINLDFMGARKKAFFMSGTLVLASLLIISMMGLNLGIDFKGGSSLTVAFKKDTMNGKRSDLEASIANLIRKELGDDTTQVTVQDFDSGIQSTSEDGTEIDRFIINTEATSLISAEKKALIAKSLVNALSAGKKKAKVTYAGEGADTYYLVLPTEVGITETAAKIRSILTAGCKTPGKDSLCFKQVTIESNLKSQLEVGAVKDLQLFQSENKTADAAKLREIKEKQSKQITAQMKGKKDRRFTINIEELRVKVADVLKKDFGGAFVTVASSTSVSPSVGESLLFSGIVAILYAIIGILIYIVLRFDVRFAPGAVVALVHDVVITIGIFSLFQIKFSLPIIAALLTIVGYSLNDTIVVLDRVRETFQDLRGKDLRELLNRAINNTLSRTVLTSLTTGLVVMAILILGGGLIRDFSLALIIGVVIGTYSSIFVASPFVYYMDIYLKRREEALKRKGNPHDSTPRTANA